MVYLGLSTPHRLHDALRNMAELNSEVFDALILGDLKTGYTSGNFPFAAYELLRADSPVFSSLFAFKAAGRLNVLIHGQVDLANAQYASSEFFSGLGVPPSAGRLIDATDDRAGAPPSK